MINVIGKKAYKKHGFFSELIGIVEVNKSGISPYILRFKDGGGVGFVKKEDIVLVEDADMND